MCMIAFSRRPRYSALEKVERQAERRVRGPQRARRLARWDQVEARNGRTS